MWRLLPEVRRGEGGRVTFFAGLAAGVNVAQTVGLAGAEAILLGRLGAGALPPVFVLAAAVTVGATLVYAAAVGRARNDRLMVVLLALGAVATLGGFAAARLPLAWVPPALLCAYFVAQAVLMNHLFTFASDYFDTLASKRVVPLLTLGGAVGGSLGGVAAVVTARLATPEALIAVWAVALAASCAWVLAFASKLRRWRAVALDEGDESSLHGLAASLRYARRSPLSRWLVASVLAMVVALFVSQYLYSAVFAENLGSSAALASFLGVYLAASNLLEIVTLVLVTPWLIRRFGVASANLAHAGTTLLAFAALAVDFRLAAAVGARLNREMLDNALAQPVRNLVYNALPLRVRGRMRALLEGIVLYSGMAVAGGLLLAVPAADPRLLCAAGAAVALLYVAAGLGARSAYLEELLEQLREGRLDLADVGEGLGAADLARLGALWSQLLATDAAAGAAAELAPRLAAGGVLEPLVLGARHPSSAVRRACVGALARSEEDEARAALATALDDPDGEVRRLAVIGLGAAAGDPVLERRLDDPDARVRAAAALRHSSRGTAVLEEMTRAKSAAEACAALEVLPPDRTELAAARADDPDPTIRAAALRALARAGDGARVPEGALAAGLSDRDAEVRLAALEAADALLGEDACAVIAPLLDDPARAVRAGASRALARRGEAGIDVAEPHLRGRPWTASAAARVLGLVGTPAARAALARALRARVDDAWSGVLALRALEGASGTAARWLASAHGDAVVRNVGMAFRLLRQLEGADAIAHLDRAIRLGSPRRRADALEVLSNLGDRSASGRLALLLEPAHLEDKLRAAGVASQPPGVDELLERARRDPDRWVSIAAQEATEEVAPEERLVERLLALRQIPLFARLSLDQLESVNRAMQVEPYTRGEVVVREGERGDRLYLLLEGEVEIYAGWGSDAPLLLNRLRPVSSFGERAVLHDEVRTASAVTTQDSLLASLDGDRMKELIRRMPDISFAIFRELIERARVAEERLRRTAREEEA